MELSDDLDPMVVWQQAERYLGSGTRSYSRFATHLEISPEFHPQLGRSSFVVPSVRVPPGAGEYFRTVGSDLHNYYCLNTGFLLPVHPDTLTFPDLHGRADLLRFPAGPPIEVVPSANARTLFVTGMGGRTVKPHFVKLHYPRRLSRFTRRLRRPIIGLHLWVSDELRRWGAPVLPEVGGGVIGDDPHESWGFLLREMSTGPEMATGTTVPLFALYGDDWRNPGDRPLLEQLVRRRGVAPLDFVSEQIVRPMILLWTSALLNTGCVLEMHGQNTLLTFWNDRPDVAISYRDCAVYVDRTTRAGNATGEPTLPGINVISRDVVVPAAQVFSLGYDSFMGHHALDYVAAVADRTLGVEPEALRAVGRAEFAARMPHGEMFPPTIYYYDDQLHPDGGWNLVDTGHRPAWR